MPPRVPLATLALAAAGVLATDVRAQGAPPAAAPVASPSVPPIAAGDSASAASVERLVSLTYPEAVHQQMIEHTLRMMTASNPMMSGIGPQLRGFFAKNMSYAALRADQVRVVRESYTAREVRELTQFYASDVGRRFAVKAPSVSMRAQALSMARLQAGQAELMGIMAGAMGVGQAP